MVRNDPRSRMRKSSPVSTVTIFASDPVSQSKVLAFILSQAAPLNTEGGQVSMHLTKSVDVSKRFSATRNPVNRVVGTNIIPEPETLRISAQLSANPLGKGSLSNVVAQIGALGSVVRLDLEQLQRLRKLADSREPLIVVAPPRTYANMALVSLDEKHVGSNKVELVLSFEEIRIVSPLLVPEVHDEAILGAYVVENMGGQVPIPI